MCSATCSRRTISSFTFSKVSRQAPSIRTSVVPSVARRLPSAVEEGFFHPARISADGDTLVAADDPEEPDVCDDAVDELIETVLSRGGWVALLADGTLPPDARVALALRQR